MWSSKCPRHIAITLWGQTLFLSPWCPPAPWSPPLDRQLCQRQSAPHRQCPQVCSRYETAQAVLSCPPTCLGLPAVGREEVGEGRRGEAGSLGLGAASWRLMGAVGLGGRPLRRRSERRALGRCQRVNWTQGWGQVVSGWSRLVGQGPSGWSGWLGWSRLVGWWGLT